MMTARAQFKADEGQADCYWHDQTTSLNYLIVLQGVVQSAKSVPEDLLLAKQDGTVNAPTKEFLYLSANEPGLLPGACGGVTVMLVL